MDPEMLRIHAKKGYIITDEGGGDFIELQESGSPCTADPDRESFWRNIVKFLNDEDVTFTLQKYEGICPECRNHPVFSKIEGEHTLFEPSIIRLLEPKEHVETNLKFHTNIIVEEFEESKKLMQRYGCQFGEIERIVRDFNEDLIRVQIYIPIRLISKIIIQT